MCDTHSIFFCFEFVCAKNFARAPLRTRMASRRRPGRATTAATVGLCLAAVTTTHTSVAFHLHTAPRGTVAVGSGGCDHAPAARRSATCRLAMLRRGGGKETPPSAEVDNGDKGSDRREGRAAKELSALLLSAMLLGNPQLSDAAAVTQAAAAGGGGGSASAVDPTVQGRLIADLENRLMRMATSDSDAAGGADSAASAAAAPAARANTAPQKAVAATGAAEVDDDAPRIQPMFVPPAATSQAAAPATAQTPVPVPAPAAPEAPPAPKHAPSTATGGNSRRSSSKSKEPVIKMKDYSFSFKLPELSLPPVAPITVPEEGSPLPDMTPLFKAPSGERVAAQPDLPGAGLVREALQSVARGEGVRDLANALAAVAPKQADYNR